MIYTYNPGEVYKQAGFLQQLGGAVGWGALPASQAQEGSSLVASTQPEIGWKAEFLVREWGFAKGAKEERRVTLPCAPWLSLRILDKSAGGLHLQLRAPLLTLGAHWLGVMSVVVLRIPTRTGNLSG